MIRPWPVPSLARWSPGRTAWRRDALGGDRQGRRCPWRVWVLLGLSLPGLLAAQVQNDSRRIPLHSAVRGREALVIGNSKYDPGALRNPVNDATDVAAALRRVGFEVALVTDADRAQMEAAVEALTQRLRQRPESVGLFYFAGHGTQIDGQNYLLPVRTAFNTPTDVRHRAVAADWVLGRLEETRNALNLLILDACRDNPLARQWRSGQQGLGNMTVGSGKETLIAFATLPGKVAADVSSGRNSPYTGQLLQHLATPGLEVGELFQRVRAGVQRDTGGAQTPQEWTTMNKPFHFVEGEPPPVGSVPRRDPEEEAWNLVKDTTRAEDVRDFLRTYPGGRFTKTAELKLRQLERAAPGMTPAPAPAPAAPGTQVAVGAPPAPEPAPATTWRNSIGMEFVRIPAGEFQMGSNDKEADSDEQPVHRVRISKAFYLGRYEVTQGQWQAVMGSNPSYSKSDVNLPVENVSWEDVQEFFRRLQAREPGVTYRLPTEAEWEYAARAGSTTAYSFGNDVSQLGDYAWYDENAVGTTHVVGQKRPNAWGLYDMHGNVWEWVQDWNGPYTAAAVTDPQGPATGAYRAVRGGGWGSRARSARAADRLGGHPGYRGADVGFRGASSGPSR